MFFIALNMKSVFCLIITLFLVGTETDEANER